MKLRPIEYKDIEKLRIWKNQNRRAFFHKEVITPVQQYLWYNDYMTKEDDLMYIVEYQDIPVGCMGYRLMEDHIDIYNVILGNKKFGGKGLMSKALQIMCGRIWEHYNEDIIVKVLNTNHKAISWYSNNGFTQIFLTDDYTLMTILRGNE